jgi:hypothetical protein
MKATSYLYLSVLFIITVFLTACNGGDHKALKKTFKLAEKNVSELKQVLDHYSQPKDSLKLRAARFLMEHMWCHRAVDVSRIPGHDTLFQSLELRYMSSNQHTVAAFKEVYDSLGFSPPNALFGNSDCQMVDANYLILNIDLAFQVWQQAPWAKAVSFEDFCEYVLPYHLQMEPIELWRPGFYNRFLPVAAQSADVQDVSIVFAAVQLNMYKTARVENAFEELYPSPMGVSDMLISEMGSCIQTNIFRIMALRAVGIPVSMDYVPHWGDYGGHHEKVRLIPQKPDRLLTNANSTEYVGDIFDAINLVKKEECGIDSMVLPDWLTIHYNKRVPKIYRCMWSEQKLFSNVLQKAESDEIYPGWTDVYKRDVTEEYVVTSDVRVPVRKKNRNLLYLCVFERNKWNPVAVTAIEKGGSAVFRKIGRNIVYLPMVCEKGVLQPAALPFYLHLNGKIQNIRPDETKKQAVVLHSKYPMFVNIANRALKMQGGMFQAANLADFSDAVTLYRIVDCPFYIQQVEVTPTKSYRYYRFLPAPQFNCSIAEWSLFVQRGEDQVQLKGTIMDSDSADRKELEKAFDDNQVTFYESKGSLNAWIGMDAGKPERLVRMCFSPRGDGNGIIPGYAYELLYFDGGWKSLGSKTAQTEKSDKAVVLQYPAVPVGALLWLKCHTEGKEERIFTYLNGKQIWW